MDNNEVQGIKFSQFPSSTPTNTDTVVGLHAGANARFPFANIIAAVRAGLSNIFVPKTDVGSAGGVAELDATGKVPSSQLPAIPSTAAAVTYDNTDSGLTADNVQDAIDELADGAGGGGVDPETIAPVETSTTATVAHPLGSIFYLNDALYRALADIAVGGTINTGTGGNATQTTVAQNFKRTVTLTAAEYAQLSAAEKAADIVYIITDDNSIAAEDVTYDPTTSGLTATNVQDAVNELAANKASQSELATVESGTTASRAYAVGENFCWNGLLYRAKTAIASGASFTPGTNCETTTVMSAITANWTPVNATTPYANRNYFFKAGKFLMIAVCIQLSSNLNAGQEREILSSVLTACGALVNPNQLTTNMGIAFLSSSNDIPIRIIFNGGKLYVRNQSGTMVDTSRIIYGQIVLGIQ